MQFQTRNSEQGWAYRFIASPTLETECILFEVLIIVTGRLHVSLIMVLGMKFSCLVSLQVLHVICSKRRRLVVCFHWLTLAVPCKIRMSIIMRTEAFKNQLDVLILIQFTQLQWPIFNPVTDGNSYWILCNHRVVSFSLCVCNFRLILNYKWKKMKRRGRVTSKRLWVIGSRCLDFQGIIKPECVSSMEHPHLFFK